MSLIHESSRDNGVSTRGQEFARFRDSLLNTLTSPPKELASDVAEMNDRLRHLADRKLGRAKITPEMVVKELSVGDVQTTPVLQQFALKYANDEYIGTQIMPVVDVPAGTSSATYWAATAESAMTAPDDSIGTGGSVNEISEGLTATSATLVPFSLQERIDARTQAAMDAPVRALIDPLTAVMDALLQRQERRIATVACTSANYGSNTAAIAAADRWNTADGGDPAGAVEDAVNTLLSGTGPQRTIGFCGPTVFKTLRRHPHALDMFKYRAVGRPMLSRQEVADWLGLDDLLIGRARYNSSLLGATASYSRIWTDTLFGVVRAPQMPALRQVTFGITLQEPFAEMEFFAEEKGGWGSFVTKVAHADVPVVVAADCGYLYTTVIS